MGSAPLAGGGAEKRNLLASSPWCWATSGVPLLEEAIEFIEMLVNDSAGFKQGPGEEADDWKYVRLGYDT